MDLKNIKFDVIIIAGQSNAEGYGKSNDSLITIIDDAYEAIDANECYVEVDPSLDFYDQATIHMVYPPKVKIQPLQERSAGNRINADLSLSFASLYQKHCLDSERKVIVVKTAIGGTGFARKQQGYQTQLYYRTLMMVDYVLSLNKDNRVVAYLWHQGEHDAFEFPKKDYSQRYNDYKIEFLNQTRGVIEHFSTFTFPIITGGFIDDWRKDYEINCQAIEQALIDSCKELGNGAFVSAKGLHSNKEDGLDEEDNIHFSKEALKELGIRYFEAFKSLNN